MSIVSNAQTKIICQIQIAKSIQNLGNYQNFLTPIKQLHKQAKMFHNEHNFMNNVEIPMFSSVNFDYNFQVTGPTDSLVRELLKSKNNSMRRL